jgi:hypothetical protein
MNRKMLPKLHHYPYRNNLGTKVYGGAVGKTAVAKIARMGLNEVLGTRSCPRGERGRRQKEAKNTRVFGENEGEKDQ